MSRPLIDPDDTRLYQGRQESAVQSEPRQDTVPRSCIGRRIQVTER
jgi:hypothetical protein